MNCDTERVSRPCFSTRKSQHSISLDKNAKKRKSGPTLYATATGTLPGQVQPLQAALNELLVKSTAQ